MSSEQPQLPYSPLLLGILEVLYPDELYQRHKSSIIEELGNEKIEDPSGIREDKYDPAIRIRSRMFLLVLEKYCRDDNGGESAAMLLSCLNRCRASNIPSVGKLIKFIEYLVSEGFISYIDHQNDVRLSHMSVLKLIKTLFTKCKGSLNNPNHRECQLCTVKIDATDVYSKIDDQHYVCAETGDLVPISTVEYWPFYSHSLGMVSTMYQSMEHIFNHELMPSGGIKLKIPRIIEKITGPGLNQCFSLQSSRFVKDETCITKIYHDHSLHIASDAADSLRYLMLKRILITPGPGSNRVMVTPKFMEDLSREPESSEWSLKIIPSEILKVIREATKHDVKGVSKKGKIAKTVMSPNVRTSVTSDVQTSAVTQQRAEKKEQEHQKRLNTVLETVLRTLPSASGDGDVQLPQESNSRVKKVDSSPKVEELIVESSVVKSSQVESSPGTTGIIAVDSCDDTEKKLLESLGDLKGQVQTVRNRLWKYRSDRLQQLISERYALEEEILALKSVINQHSQTTEKQEKIITEQKTEITTLQVSNIQQQRTIDELNLRCSTLLTQQVLDQKNNESTSKSGKSRTLVAPLRFAVWKKYFTKVDEHCPICKCDLSINSWEAGHVISSANGGKAEVDNMVPICSSCNRSMGKTNMTDYVKQNFRMRYRFVFSGTKWESED